MIYKTTSFFNVQTLTHKAQTMGGIIKGSDNLISIKRALISVSDKEGIVEFAKGLNDLGVEILSTGGTARLLSEKGVPVTLLWM